MNPDSKRPPDYFLPFELSYIPDFLKSRAKSELFEDEEARVQSLKLLRSFLKDEPGLQWQDDDLFLLSFLRARKFDVKRAFQLVKNFYTVMGKHHELYHNFNFADVKRTIEGLIMGFLPYRDADGCVVLYVPIKRWNPHEISFGDVVRAVTCSLHQANLSPATHIAGFKIIFDFNGLRAKHLPHLSPTYIWLFLDAMQNCYPGRFKSIHLINNNAYISSLITLLMKTFLSKKNKEKIHFHGKNLQKLYKYIDPAILPAELEGGLPTFDNTAWRKKMEENSEYIAHVLSYGYNRQRTESQDKKKENF